jgi:hypothetical protein
MFNSILREVKDLAGQLYRLDYGWRTLANVIKQIACYAKYRNA